MTPIVIRTSDRGIFKRCRQMWDFTSKIRGNWEPIQRYPAFDFGTAMHEGWRAYYEPATWGNLPLMRQNARDAFCKSFAALATKVKVGNVEFELRFKEDTKLGLDMLEYYFLWAPKQDNFRPIYVEIEFEVEIPSMDIPYQGRIDLIVEDEYGYWIVDHKTAAQFSDLQWLALDDQCSSYAWAIKKMLGLEVRGVIYNQARKSPPHPPIRLKNGGFSRNKQQNTTFETYLATLRAEGIDPRHYRSFLSYLKHNPKEFCRRYKVTYSPRTLDIVEKRIQLEARDMTNNPQIYPSPSPMNCNGCRFFVPCLALQEGGDAQTILEDLYTHDRS